MLIVQYYAVSVLVEISSFGLRYNEHAASLDLRGQGIIPAGLTKQHETEYRVLDSHGRLLDA
jgi:hypothetical protein